MQIQKSKQAQKYLKGLQKSLRESVESAIEGLKEAKGDILKIKGKDMYRLKIPPLRVGFKLDHENQIIEVVLIRPRGDFYKHI